MNEPPIASPFDAAGRPTEPAVFTSTPRSLKILVGFQLLETALHTLRTVTLSQTLRTSRLMTPALAKILWAARLEGIVSFLSLLVCCEGAK